MTLTINGSTVPADGIHSGPVLCEQGNQNQCYQPSVDNSLNISKNKVNPTSLQTSLSSLFLSVTDLTEFGLSPTTSGIPRVITITNTGNAPTNGLLVASSGLPSDTTHATTCTDSLAAGDTCTITVIPGTIASSDGNNPCSNGTTPIPGTVQVSANNANTVSTNVTVLSYGCIYQGGYIYAFDDTTLNTGNVGGKVVSTSDQAPAYPNGIIWSSNGLTSGTSGPTNVADTSVDIIPGVNQNSLPLNGSPTYSEFTTYFQSTYTNQNPFNDASFSMCNGLSDGACNTKNIVTFYNQFITNNTSLDGGSPFFTAIPGPTDPNYYAAGLCKQMSDGGYSDWYLPSICEMGYASAACRDSSSTSLQQNIQLSLLEISGFSTPLGQYWSSNQANSSTRDYAFVINFGLTISLQFITSKAGRNGVRCARIISI